LQHPSVAFQNGSPAESWVPSGWTYRNPRSSASGCSWTIASIWALLVPMPCSSSTRGIGTEAV
jgi:hypothetical protein